MFFFLSENKKNERPLSSPAATDVLNDTLLSSGLMVSLCLFLFYAKKKNDQNTTLLPCIILRMKVTPFQVLRFPLSTIHPFSIPTARHVVNEQQCSHPNSVTTPPDGLPKRTTLVTATRIKKKNNNREGAKQGGEKNLESPNNAETLNFRSKNSTNAKNDGATKCFPRKKKKKKKQNMP